jgi:hypothetical protein
MPSLQLGERIKSETRADTSLRPYENWLGVGAHLRMRPLWMAS